MDRCAHSVSMKLRQMFYTQIERRTFHTAWVIILKLVRPQLRGPLYLDEPTSSAGPTSSEKCIRNPQQYRKSLSSFGRLLCDRDNPLANCLGDFTTIARYLESEACAAESEILICLENGKLHMFTYALVIVRGELNTSSV
jgi:hypothetical protein